MTLYVDTQKASKELIKSKLFIQNEIENLKSIAGTLRFCDTDRSVVKTLKSIKGVAINIIDEITELEPADCDRITDSTPKEIRVPVHIMESSYDAVETMLTIRMCINDAMKVAELFEKNKFKAELVFTEDEK